MKVIKPFVRDGERFSRGDKAPAGLDKETIAHYLNLGLLDDGDASAARGVVKPALKTPGAPTPVRRTALPGPRETKPAAPAQTALAGADPVAASLGDSKKAEPAATAEAAVAAVAAAETVATPQGASLPLGPVDASAD